MVDPDKISEKDMENDFFEGMKRQEKYQKIAA